MVKESLIKTVIFGLKELSTFLSLTYNTGSECTDEMCRAKLRNVGEVLIRAANEKEEKEYRIHT